jgi:hypothetical protein
MRFCSLLATRTASAATFETWIASVLKNILVHIPTERSIRPIVDGAISLAMTHAAHLDAVSIGFELANVGLAIDGGAAIATVYEVEHEAAEARANAALAVLKRKPGMQASPTVSSR